MRMWMYLLLAGVIGGAIVYYTKGFGKLQAKA